MKIGRDTPAADAVREVRAWVEANVPRAWIDAGRRGGAAAVREVRPRAEYEAWYPVFAASGLVVPTWPVAYGGLDLSPQVARAVDAELRPFNLGRLNPLGLNNTAPALFAYGTEEQRLRFLPPIVRNEEKWCQLFSEPGAGSDLASLATPGRARRRRVGASPARRCGPRGRTSPTSRSCLARTDPTRPKRQGITYFLLDLHQPGVEVRPLRHIGGEVDFNEVFLDRALVPDAYRVGEVGEGWKVANATLSGERQMVSGGGLGRRRPHRRRGASSTCSSSRRATRAATAIRVVRQRLMRVLQRGAHPRLDEPARARAGQGRPRARSGELDRQGAPGRAEPAHPAARDRPARRGRDGVGPTDDDGPSCRSRCAACCAAAPTRSRAARPRSTRTSSASGCSVCRASPIRGRVRPGAKSRGAEPSVTVRGVPEARDPAARTQRARSAG